MQEGYALNPQTNRIIKTSTAKYKKLVKLGIIVPEVKNEVEKVVGIPEVKKVVENIPEVQNAVIPEVKKVVSAPPVKALLAQELTDIVAEHKAKFTRELTEKETNLLLKQLLYEKLVKQPKKPKKPKSKKTKFKLRTPPSSDQSESESD
jgi:hypothetical protein